MSGEDAALQRATVMGDAARARAIASAGEFSAIAALRRDGDLTNDNGGEPWANIADRGSPITGGRFQLAIGDAQGKLNLNRLVQGDPLTRRRLETVTNALRLPRDTPDHIAGFISVTGPLSDLGQLAAIGLSPADIARLATMVTAVPQATMINLNATPEPLLALLL
jgi:general secretion pathway protein K